MEAVTSRTLPPDDDRRVPAPRRGRRPTLSLDAVAAGALEILDVGGEDALTFRSLARSLETGVGSVYHYVASKDELLDHVTDGVLGRVIAALTLPEDPYAALRAIADGLYDAMGEHRRIGSYLLRNSGMMTKSMELFELIGSQLTALPPTDRQRLDAVDALIAYVTGVGADIHSYEATLSEVEGTPDADEMRSVARQWAELDAERLPFMRSVAAEFESHDNRTRFRARVDLILAGIERQAEAGE